MSAPNIVFDYLKTEGSLGEGAGLSTSNSSNLAACYPDSPIHQTGPKISIDGNAKVLHGAQSNLEYKRHYYDVCLRGQSKSSAFGKQDMSFGTSNLEGYDGIPPTYDDIKPEDEPTIAGFPGSTISKSGLGPNISIDPAVMADVKPAASQPAPERSSFQMVPTDITKIPSKFNLGSSFSKSIAEEIGTINDGQSAVVD